jgi:putative NADPH-quinone reductase
MQKNILIICGHPDPAPERFYRPLSKAYARGTELAGHHVRFIDVALLDKLLLRTKSDF